MPKNIKKLLAEKSAAGIAIAEKAKAEGRDFTAEELAELSNLKDEISGLEAKAKAADNATSFIESLGTKKYSATDSQAKSLGDQFLKYGLEETKQVVASAKNFSVVTPEFKAAATDSHLVGDAGLVQQDTTVAHAIPHRDYISDWLTSGTMAGSILRYVVEGARTGDFATVAEGGKKPQLNFGYKQQTDTLAKIAGYIKVSTEMLEDTAYIASDINTRLLEQLRIFEETQLLSGDGEGSNLKGLLNREGLLKVQADEFVPSLIKAFSQVEVTSGLRADGIVINPADYAALLASKDKNGQYFAGGPFVGQYGNGAVPVDPPILGRRTIVTPAIGEGKVLVGSSAAATVYRKGGVTLTSTNSNEDDFVHNLFLILAEERLAFAARQPSAFALLELKKPVTEAA